MTEVLKTFEQLHDKQVACTKCLEDKFSEILKIKPGETTEDGLFTLDALRCIGACGIAPAVQINGQVYPKMSVDKVAPLIQQYSNGGAQ